MRHCDEYLDDPTTPEPLRKFLEYARSPAHGQGMEPVKLVATWNEPNGPGGRPGKRRLVRVVMASRLGDVGITTDLQAEHGYQWRVPVSELSDFR
jgi:hypothetical protein